MWSAKQLTLEVLRIFLMDEVSQIPSVVENHVQRLTILESSEGLIDAPKIFFFGFTLPRKDGNTSGSNTETKISQKSLVMII